MKKLFLAAFAVCALVSVNAQSFGALGGLSMLSAKSEVGSFDESRV